MQHSGTHLSLRAISSGSASRWGTGIDELECSTAEHTCHDCVKLRHHLPVVSMKSFTWGLESSCYLLLHSHIVPLGTWRVPLRRRPRQLLKLQDSGSSPSDLAGPRGPLSLQNTAAAGIWRDFPFSSSPGQLTIHSHFPWLLTVPGGGGTRSRLFCFTLWTVGF